MSIGKDLRSLCSPAFFYLSISVLGLLVSLIENRGNTDTYNVGAYSLKVSSLIIAYGFQIVYVIFWAWVLNLICKSGHKNIAWFLVLIPYILFFVLVGSLFVLSED